jgi:Xaa-Pro aminopeptidase
LARAYEDLNGPAPSRPCSGGHPNNGLYLLAHALYTGVMCETSFHGVGLSIWEKPVFSRLVSVEHPEVIEEGMVFAHETYWPSSDGWGAAQIEEELTVTADGCDVITKSSPSARMTS